MSQVKWGMAIGMLGVLVLVAVSIVVLLVLLRGSASRRRRSELAACGRCGYAVRGVSTLNCPECGADLREVGITTPGQHRGMGPGAFLLLWTVLLPFPVFVFSGFIIRLIPLQASGTAFTNLVPQSHVFQSVDLEMTFSRANTQAGVTSSYTRTGQMQSSVTFSAVQGNPPDMLRFTIRPLPTPGILTPSNTLSVDPKTLHYRYTAAPASSVKVVSTKGLEGAAVEAWLTAAGVPVTTQDIKDEAQELAVMATELCQGQGTLTSQHFTFNGSSSMIRSRPPMWFTSLLIFFWLGVYIGGIALVVQSHRRKTALAL